MADLENCKTLDLKNLGVLVKPPSKMVAQPICAINYGKIYYGAKVYEFRDTWLEYVGTFYSLSESALKKELKESFNCHYLMTRNIKNFVNWYQSFGRKLTTEEIKSISKKF